MSTEPFIGEVKLLGFNFPPIGYMTCQGQIISIASYTALFSLIGTTYGGNGQTTFALPDLQGRMPVGQGQGPGLPEYRIEKESGNTTIA
jgi:microcystin-dependent protein